MGEAREKCSYLSSQNENLETYCLKLEGDVTNYVKSEEALNAEKEELQRKVFSYEQQLKESKSEEEALRKDKGVGK